MVKFYFLEESRPQLTWGCAQEKGEARPSFVLDHLQRIKESKELGKDDPFAPLLKHVAAVFSIGGIDTVSCYNVSTWENTIHAVVLV